MEFMPGPPKQNHNSPKTQKNSQKQPEKPRKRSKIFAFLKYIVLTILAVAVLAGIVFQLPWKINGLLFTFFAANTLLQKPAVKCFWLCVLAVVITLAIWLFLPDAQEKGWKTYKFEDEIQAFHQKYSVPENANAAVVYNNIFAEYNEDELTPSDVNTAIYDKARRNPWTAEHYPKLAQWLDSREDLLGRLEKINRYEKCYFRHQPDVFFIADETIDNLAKVRKIAYLLILSANKDFGESRTEQAVSKYLTAMQMGKHFIDQPDLIESLVGVVVEALAMGKMKTFVISGELDDVSIKRMREQWPLLKEPWRQKSHAFLDFERLQMKSLFAGLYQVNEEGKTRITYNTPEIGYNLSCLNGCSADQGNKHGYWRNCLGKFTSTLAGLWLPDSPQRVSYLVDAAYAHIYFHSQKNNDSEITTHRFGPWNIHTLNFRATVESMVNILRPAMNRIRQFHSRFLTDRRGCYLLIALRRYKNETNRWPDSLEQVGNLAPQQAFTDAYNDEPFVYQKTEDAFILYSKGANGKDEDGHRSRCNEPDDKADDWLIWQDKLENDTHLPK